ncbi:DUF2767 family protein [Rahnella sp. C60]|uniref:DUF2767 family protein n=1 Tax=Rahnella perminowiae TaxID=2816244 RepID=UPI001C26955A|nr:DUF2767 family protein [Rahnella perminowiae]MBU9815464.1 DUF2767 family protein [Rahnella perminowiae]
MDYGAEAEHRHYEMCRLVGNVVFAMVTEGHEIKRVAIAYVLCTEIGKGDWWIFGQLKIMKLAVKIIVRARGTPTEWPGWCTNFSMLTR